MSSPIPIDVRQEDIASMRASSSPFAAVTRQWPLPPGAAAFRGIAGEFVAAIEPQSEADPAALLVQKLVFFGNCIGRSAHFRVEAGSHCANMFAVLVGDTSTARKGTSLLHCIRFFDWVDLIWSKSRVLSGASSGEGLIHSVRDPVIGREPIKEKGKITGYQEVELDAGVEDKRLLVLASEFSSVLKVSARDGNILTGVCREGWDTGRLRAMSKNSPAVATDAHISILGHVTVGELALLADRTDAVNGFFNRFLWCCVKRSKSLPHGGCVSDEELEPIVAQTKLSIDFARKKGEMQRDQQARELWESVYESLFCMHAGILGAVLGRAHAHVVRLSLIYALLDRSDLIRVEHLEAALALWKYMEDSAAYIFGDALGDATAEKIISALRENPLGITRTEIVRLFSGHRSAKEIDGALQLLLRQGLAIVAEEKTSGRPVEKWLAVQLNKGGQK